MYSCLNYLSGYLQLYVFISACILICLLRYFFIHCWILISLMNFLSMYLKHGIRVLPYIVNHNFPSNFCAKLSNHCFPIFTNCSVCVFSFVDLRFSSFFTLFSLFSVCSSAASNFCLLVLTLFKNRTTCYLYRFSSYKFHEDRQFRTGEIFVQ